MRVDSTLVPDLAGHVCGGVTLQPLDWRLNGATDEKEKGQLALTLSRVALRAVKLKSRPLMTQPTSGGSNSIIVCHDIVITLILPLNAVVSSYRQNELVSSLQQGFVRPHTTPKASAQFVHDRPNAANSISLKPAARRASRLKGPRMTGAWYSAARRV